MSEPQTVLLDVNPSVYALKESFSRLLNTYLRETSQFCPVSGPTHPLNLQVELPRTGITVYGILLHLSPGGHHVFGDEFYKDHDGQRQNLDMETLMSMLTGEISFAESDPAARSVKKEELERLLNNSKRHMERYFHHFLKQSKINLDFRTCEQLLLGGHPFHPTPKSLEGFSPEDSLAYSPEFRTSFTLHGFAIARSHLAENWLAPHMSGNDAPWVPEALRQAARSKVNGALDNYALLPCHPWQARYLLSLPPVQELVRKQIIIDLGASGPVVYPTSSVRTVWNAEDNCFYKLSLHIRITNFIRENNLEQLLRTYDAARIVHKVRKESYFPPSFRILLDEGYRTVQIPDAAQQVSDRVTAGFSMIMREAPAACNDSNQPPYVIASLLEIPPGDSMPLLFHAVRNGLKDEEPEWISWFQTYLDISMKPVLQLFVEKGISLEAHVQNAMIGLEHGMPSIFYIRDLEGISVNRDISRMNGWTGTLVEEESPVLYSEAETRHRLKYYFFVNHLSHLIQRLALCSRQDEEPFWLVVRNTLQQMQQDRQWAGHSYMSAVLKDLLDSDTLPAKANLLSRFHKRGEKPLYVDIPNPVKHIR
ncbi:IucA/IucC family protein [Paenibacillus pinihumi]|uniref:IucA/IucC family protein n=1 Tax=Paenibacillus pinihumi TaxID=669462 RepID=UPI00041E4E0B|nr:IucA/IucC family protein [Paenibacillus pinihumi]